MGIKRDRVLLLGFFIILLLAIFGFYNYIFLPMNVKAQNSNRSDIFRYETGGYSGKVWRFMDTELGIGCYWITGIGNFSCVKYVR